MIDTDKYEGHTPGPWCYDMHAEWAEETYYLGEEEQQLWRDRTLKASKESKEHEPYLSPMIEQYEKDDEGKHRYSTFCVRILRGLLWKSDYSGYRFGDENGFIPEERGAGINVPTPDEIRANARLIAAAPDLLAEVKRLREEVKRLRRADETTTKYLSFALSLLTDEQDCEYTHFVGGLCTHDCCPYRGEEE